MLFVVTDELRKRFPSCNIYFASSENYHEEHYTFRKLHTSPRVFRVAARGFDGLKALCGGIIRDIVKLSIGRKNNILLGHYHDLARVMLSMTALIDISGFAISSKWGNNVPKGYLAPIKAARAHNIPVYLMPQSFGPFNYTPDVMREVKLAIQDVLAWPRIIFAREREGYDYMTQLFGLQNVQLSADLVLQNKGINPANIFTSPRTLSVPKISSDCELAGIVPNMRCFDHGSKAKILDAYRRIIDLITSQGFRVVLFRHSREDIEACRLLKSFYPDNDNITLIENDFDCMEYNEFVRQFKFLVCSRYHGLVHAYKNNVPCVALGWAVKYRSLAEVLGQSGYVFDITAENPDITGILEAISRLINSYDSECRTIREKLTEIQARNCFDILEADLRDTGVMK